MTHKPMEVKTRGWLLVDDTEGVSVANEESTTADGSTVFRGRTFIPRAMIQSVVPYRLAVVSPRKPRQVKSKLVTAPVDTPQTDSN